MKKIILLLLLAITTTTIFAQNVQEEKTKKAADVLLVLLRNLNAGYSFNNTTNYRLDSYHAGTNYAQSFKKRPAAHWQVGVYAYWSDYLMKDGTPDFKTTSVSVPFRIGYKVFSNDLLSFRINLGPTYEYVFHSNYSSDANKIQRSQLALSVGGNVQIFNVTNLYVSYKYYPIGLFSNGDFQHSAFNFSIGL